jgi:neutral trehalase
MVALTALMSTALNRDRLHNTDEIQALHLGVPKFTKAKYVAGSYHGVLIARGGIKSTNRSSPVCQPNGHWPTPWDLPNPTGPMAVLEQAGP